MTMPKYPHEGKNREFVDIVKDILQSAALEELAIAHLINAEAEKIQAFTGHLDHNRSNIKHLVA